MPPRRLGVVWHVDRQLAPSAHRFAALAVEVCAALQASWGEPG
jgi:hypothetical protein